MNREIKKVEYDDLKCFMNEDAICPYCGYEKIIEPESYGGQEEEVVDECDDCGRKFVHQIDYKITFTSEPYENWLLRQINNYKNRIKHYEELRDETPTDREQGLNKEYYQGIIDYINREFSAFKSKVEVENE